MEPFGPFRIQNLLTLSTYPLIMAKDSSLEKYELPGKTVTVSLPEIYNKIQY